MNNSGELKNAGPDDDAFRLRWNVGRSKGAVSVSPPISSAELFSFIGMVAQGGVDVLPALLEKLSKAPGGQPYPLFVQRFRKYLELYFPLLVEILRTPPSSSSEWREMLDRVPPLGEAMFRFSEPPLGPILSAVPGRPDMWLKLLVAGLEHLTPIEVDECLEIAEMAQSGISKVKFDEGAGKALLGYIQPSIDRGLIGIDIHGIYANDEWTAVAYAWSWLIKAHIQLHCHLPDKSHVDMLFGRPHGTLEAMSEEGWIKLAIMALNHPFLSNVSPIFRTFGGAWPSNPSSFDLPNGMRFPNADILFRVDNEGCFRGVAGVEQGVPNGALSNRVHKAVTPATPHLMRHSDDFREVFWSGIGYHFSTNQAEVVRRLWTAYQAGTPSVSGENLVDGNGTVRDVFKVRGNQFHEAWKTMIQPVEGKRNLFRLVAPE